MNVPNEKLVSMFQKMLTIRHFESSILNLYQKGLVPGLAHLYLGEEAIATGVAENLRNDDYIIGTHRSHGHAIAKGASLRKLAAEILGKKTGFCKGFGGSMRLVDTSIGLLYTCPIVGANLPLGVGVALAIKMKKTDQVVCCFIGDGASNAGSFHESLNLASVWKLPLLVVVENNRYAISVPFTKSTSVDKISKRAVAYNIPGVTIDGNDVIGVYKAAAEAIETIRRGGGPYLLECLTYRPWGHHAGEDPLRYRSREEIEEYKKSDPLERFKNVLIEQKVLDKQEIDLLEQKIKEEIDDAVKFALESPYPSLEDMLMDIASIDRRE